MKTSTEASQPDLTDQQLVARHQEIQRGLARSNLASVVALVVSVGLAAVAVFYGFMADQHATEANRAHQRRTEELWKSRLAQAKALRLSGKVGRRQEGLEAIRQAVGIRGSPELRDEAIATLALTDIQPGTVWQPASPQVNCYGMCPRLTYYALGYVDGRVQVFEAASGRSVLEFKQTNQAVYSVNFSPDERYVAARSNKGTLEVWHLADCSQAFAALYPQDWPSSHSVGFDPGSGRVAIACGDNTVRVIDLAARRVERTLPTQGRPWTVRFDPRAQRLAVGIGTEVHILEYSTGELLAKWNMAEGVGIVEWHPDGNTVAVGSPGGRVVLVDVQSGKVKMPAGHTQRVISLAFHPSGRLLASAAWDGVSRFWDTRSGRLLLETDSGYALNYDQSGERLGFFREGVGVGDWRVDRGTTYRSLALPLNAPREILGLDISRDGRLAAATTTASVHLFDLHGGREVASFRWIRSWGIGFTEDSQALVLSSDNGLYRVTVHPDGTNSWRLGKPEPLAGAPPGGYGHAYVAFGDRRWFGVEGATNIVVVDLDAARAVRHLPTRGWHSSAVPSPDGTLVAISQWKGGGTEVVNLASGKQVAQWKEDGGVALFSPDGRWLVVGTANEFLFYDTRTWRLARRIERESASAITGFLAFSPDSRILATAHTLRQVRLLVPDTGTVLATLHAPAPERITTLSFSGTGELLAAGTDNGEIQLWDLKELRGQLRLLGLDWDDRGEAAAHSKRGQQPASNGAAGSTPPAFRRHAVSLAGAGAALALVFALSSIQRHRRLIEAHAAVEQMAAQHRGELRMAQTQLLHSHKMRALGTLAAGIAHDFNNLLSIIRMSSQLVARQTKPSGATKENLDAIEQAVVQGKEIVRSILGYSRKPTDPLATYSAAAAVSETLAMLSKQYLGGIVLTLELDQEAPPVHGDRSRLEQVLLNLIVNAAEAMQGRGKLLIRVKPVAAAGAGILRARPAPGYAEMIVSDSGPGISPEVLPRVFEPFFTTKQPGSERGAGLGLTTVYTIAQQDGWGLAVQTAQGAGTTFQLWLPGQELDHDATRGAAAAPQTKGHEQA